MKVKLLSAFRIVPPAKALFQPPIAQSSQVLCRQQSMPAQPLLGRSAGTSGKTQGKDTIAAAPCC